MFTNAILPHRTAVVNRTSWVRGAVSFRRRLGCAQKVIARVRPSAARRGALNRAHLAPALCCPRGPMLGSHQRRRPPHATGLSLGECLQSERTVPTDAGIVEGADQRCVHNRIVLGWTAQPNGLRLSCGAELEDSQM